MKELQNQFIVDMYVTKPIAHLAYALGYEHDYDCTCCANRATRSVNPLIRQEDIQKWLREEHNIHCVIQPFIDDLGVYTYGSEITNVSFEESEWNEGCVFDTYEQALMDAILDGLRQVGNKI